ncbi:MAG: hypothetical protein HC839_00825 [Leptolyngbyaceae cyanobacterium RM2_2_21]|nr:hypothetical protein [Leptolyngbyaceae cyanobacterium RM2_2_21]
MLRFLSIFPFHISQGGISHIFLSLCMPRFNAPVRIEAIGSSIAKDTKQSNLSCALPPYSNWLVYQLRASRQITEWKFGRRLKSFDAAYIWPGVSIYALEQAQAQKKPIDHGMEIGSMPPLR